MRRHVWLRDSAFQEVEIWLGAQIGSSIGIIMRLINRWTLSHFLPSQLDGLVSFLDPWVVFGIIRLIYMISFSNSPRQKRITSTFTSLESTCAVVSLGVAPLDFAPHDQFGKAAFRSIIETTRRLQIIKKNRSRSFLSEG